MSIYKMVYELGCHCFIDMPNVHIDVWVGTFKFHDLSDVSSLFFFKKFVM